MKVINIIGAGLAGCEAAYQLVKRGYIINLYEGKKYQKNEIQKLDTYAELVCSNTFRSKSRTNAAGILKYEMKKFDSLIIKIAEECEIPADDALAVDREIFSKKITNFLKKFKNIKIIEKNIEEIDFKLPTIIATGPLTSDKFFKFIELKFGKQNLFYLDASAPIVTKKSLDLSQFTKSSRHKNDNSYLCLPLNKLEFDSFYNKLICAETINLHSFEKEIYFRGCKPIEVLAKESYKILLNGPMSKNNLFENEKNVYAAIQLRQDDVNDNLYNIVGFQTNVKWSEQKKVISSLKGFHNAEFVRYGVMHKNKYINSPKLLKSNLQAKGYENIFFAGQITGVEGYIESASSGIVAALGMNNFLLNKQFEYFPVETVMGSLINYITNKKNKNLKPMKANMGLLPTINGEFISKHDKNLAIFERSMNCIENYIKKNNL